MEQERIELKPGVKVPTTPRRNFLVRGILAIIAGLVGKEILSAAPPRGGTEDKKSAIPPAPAAAMLMTEGEVLKTTTYKGRPQPMEPLDTMVRMERVDNNNERAMTHEILSLMHEEKGTKSYPWTIYSHLTTQHVEGDACVLCSRLHKNGPGWSCGLHSEVFSNAPMVGLGVNIEMSNAYKGPEQTLIIGMNVQAHGPYDSQYGIQVHDADGHFEKGIGLNGKGKVGLDLGGEFGVGINTGNNSIRVAEGTPIELDKDGKIKIRYQNGRIEFLNGDKCIGHIKVDREDHEI